MREFVTRTVVRSVNGMTRSATHIAAGVGAGGPMHALATLMAREADFVLCRGRQGLRGGIYYSADTFATAFLGVLKSAGSMAGETTAPVCRCTRVGLGAVLGRRIAVEVGLVAGLAGVFWGGFFGSSR